LYATLGVPQSADAAEIRKAYRRLALRWHPDKNPDDPSATEQFQKVSTAYEVLSDEQRREMYDSTGCIDAEEFEEQNFDHAADLFSYIFRNMDEDLDADEQGLLDEFLRCAGTGAFRRRGRRKKGRGKSTKTSSSRFEEQMFSELFGSLGSSAEPVCCPDNHRLKRRKCADEDYECDVCSSDIVAGKRFFDCRKCDYSICPKCHKKAQAVAIAQAEDEEEETAIPDEMMEELLDAFCRQHTTPVQQGHRLRFRCEFCNNVLNSDSAVFEHMHQRHEDKMEEFLMVALEECGSQGGMGSFFGAEGIRGDPFGDLGGLEALFMMGMDMEADGPPPGPSRSSKPKGHRKKR